MNRFAKLTLAALAAVASMQLVRCPHDNPPGTREVDAPPEVRAVLRRACYDCHSNETVWPFYAQLAPGSWLLYRDVKEGREHLNFSEWDKLPEENRARKKKWAYKEAKSGDMPLWFYLPLHPRARLTDEDLALLKTWSGSD